MIPLIVGVGSLAILFMVLTSRRVEGVARWCWNLMALACTFWTLSLLITWLDGPGWLSWGVCRGLGLVCLIATIAISPEVHRSSADWRLLVLDAWTVSVSTLLMLWTTIQHGLLGLGPAQVYWPAVAWVCLIAGAATIFLGLASQATRADRLPLLLILGATAVSIGADTTWSLTQNKTLGISLWLLMLFLVTNLAFTRTVRILASPQRQERPSQVTRYSQLLAAPALLLALLYPVPGAVTMLAAIGAIMGVAMQLILAMRQNGRLWDTVHRRATTDELTGLLNRSTFLESASRRLASHPCTIVFIDLDRFKEINDMEGHLQGDRVLQQAGRAVALCLNPRDKAARIGGDEFAVLVASPDPIAAVSLADRLVHTLSGKTISGSIGASIGIARGHAVSADSLLGDADLAMYEAKRRGGNRFVVFESWMRERKVARTNLTDALRKDIERGRIELDAQPIVSIIDGQWLGFEALVRWQNQEGRCEPDEFIPLAVENGLIVPLGELVLRRALEWIAQLPASSTLGISVNIAGQQLAEPGFAELVQAELARTGVAPNRLTLELTEQSAVEDLDRADLVLRPLRQLGVHVSLDDFGTGFSSLGYLARLPVDELKIDRRFVAGLGVRSEDDALVRAVVGLAEDLGLRVVAEGVENERQAQELLTHGCLFAQGFHLCRPMSMAQAPTAPAVLTAVPSLRPKDQSVASTPQRSLP